MLTTLRTVTVVLLICLPLLALAQELRAIRDVEIKESPPSKYLFRTGDNLEIVQKGDVVTQLEKRTIKTPIREYIWLRIKYRNPRSRKIVTGWAYSGKKGEQHSFEPVN